MKCLSILLLSFSLSLSLSAAETLYYEYGADGFLVGTYTAASARPNSTTATFLPIPPARAKWSGTAWVEDETREQASTQEDTRRATSLSAARRFMREYNPDTANAAEVKQAVKALMILLRDLAQERD